MFSNLAMCNWTLSCFPWTKTNSIKTRRNCNFHLLASIEESSCSPRWFLEEKTQPTYPSTWNADHFLHKFFQLHGLFILGGGRNLFCRWNMSVPTATIAVQGTSKHQRHGPTKPFSDTRPPSQLENENSEGTKTRILQYPMDPTRTRTTLSKNI